MRNTPPPVERAPSKRWKRFSRRFGPAIGAVLRRFVFRRVRATPPVAVARDAAVEVHSLVGHRFVDMYLVSVKSLLRYEARLAVTVHDDGSLTPADVDVLLAHLPGCRVIARDAADAAMAQRLAVFPECRRFRDEYLNARQLFDFALLARSPRLLGLDADIVFARRPDALLGWIADGGNDVVYNSEPEGTQFGRMMRDHDDPCVADLNCGLIGYFPDLVDLDLVERSLARLRTRPKSRFAQGYLAICLQHSRYRAVPLDPRAYLIYTGQRREAVTAATMVHFITYLRFAQPWYPRLAMTVIRELRG